MNRLLQALFVELILLYVFCVGIATILGIFFGVPFEFGSATMLFIVITVGQMLMKMFTGKVQDGDEQN